MFILRPVTGTAKEVAAIAVRWLMNRFMQQRGMYAGYFIIYESRKPSCCINFESRYIQKLDSGTTLWHRLLSMRELKWSCVWETYIGRRIYKFIHVFVYS